MKSFTKTSLVLLLFVSTIGFSMIPAATAQSWLTGWSDRQLITITNSTGAGTNYSVYLNVVHKAGMQIDFDDLRFTEVDGITELDYWIEDYTVSTAAKVWVEVTDNLDSTDSIIYMYYGNDAVSTTSNGDDTFLFYEDWTVEAIGDQWTIGDTGGTVTWDSTDADHGSVIKVEGDAGNNRYYFYSDNSWDFETTLRTRTLLEATVAEFQQTQIGWQDPIGDAYTFLKSILGDNYFEVRDDDNNKISGAIDAGNFDAYHTFELRRDGTNAMLYTDDLLEETLSLSPDTGSWHIQLYCRDSEYDVYNDWIVIRKGIAVEPVAYWGDWTEVTTAKFVFPVGWTPEFQFGYDAFFIILGLIMIPFSTLYLVRGGMKEMSRDKLFLGLIIFLMGFGLLIGGIMP